MASINGYPDILKKYEFDYQRYKENNTLYTLLDCMLSLNAIPDWIKSTEETSNPKLYEYAIEKSKVFAKSFAFDSNQIEINIDQKLKLIRMICNHSKHNNGKDIPVIVEKYGTTLPFRLPARFQMCVFIGDKDYDAEKLIVRVYEFWSTKVTELT